ncbi:uncharacterized protein ppp1r32 isoform X1 [Sebastes umbrosus]|uniref:uncharacterized protein ppp1r32 isoform X1 n=1 Tax=Sebastes umbrosus TaxID=72105 RepID=UPI00189C6C56|nr:uncharacterized protein ppp1r32 isoform X1 [Sebastes umbrosus]XP_037622024.1 uncharacterized protein ppp1r32 isoform X1 [Sebastes umbrosus]
MAEQGRMVTPTVGATGSRGRLTSNTVKRYNTYYDPGRVNFTSYFGRPGMSGFTSNQRPAIYYRPSLDLIDNPPFGLLLSDSFTSQTKLHFQPHIRSDYSGSLPNVMNKPRDSAFQRRNRPKTVTVVGKSEYQRIFVPHRLTPTVTQRHVIVGPRGESGFTEGTNLQLITFRDKHNCLVEPLQTRSSVTKSDFIPPSFLQGTEARPCSSYFSRESGFTRGASAPLACPASLLPSQLQTKSNAPTETTIGKKEPSGHLRNASNNQAFPNTPFDRSHFSSHYRSTICRDAERRKSGHTCAENISAKMDSSYNHRGMDRFILRG